MYSIVSKRYWYAPIALIGLLVAMAMLLADIQKVQANHSGDVRATLVVGNQNCAELIPGTLSFGSTI